MDRSHDRTNEAHYVANRILGFYENADKGKPFLG